MLVNGRGVDWDAIGGSYDIDSRGARIPSIPKVASRRREDQLRVGSYAVRNVESHQKRQAYMTDFAFASRSAKHRREWR